MEFKDVFSVIARYMYNIHLVLSFIYCSILIFADSARVNATVTLSLILIIVYGFMLVWILLANIIFNVLLSFIIDFIK